ncbi:tyrosine-type recombinase/integrase [Enterovibrio norvegicus]|uniref:tyrosine-type recombinase/integrase n=1 Tax=Enterovibrio norvegicus TaxID=188144 RepID=UPI000CBCE471|nr:site-specific integrase [Enterovibrio norvegicus]PMN73756.1 hypothetical protein BCT27_01740 [Enterovibrio norvegicus]
MATFRTLPSGNVNAMIRKRGQKAITKTFTSLAAAKRWAELVESVEPVTLQFIGNKYLAKLKGRGGTESTTYRLRNLCTHLPKDPKKIKPEDLDVYIEERSRTVSDSTIRLELQLLSRIMKSARMANPVEGYTLPKAGKPRELILTAEQYKRIVNDIAPKVKPLVILSWETAMRRSEMLSITTDCIDWDRRTLLLLDTKNGHSREVPLNTRALKVLQEASHLVTSGILFSSKPYTVSQAFRRSCDRLGLHKALCFHSLRHTAITRYARLGLNAMQLQVISGHRDITMLARYTHLQASDLVFLIE